ncbi:alpha/beta hydrolase family protein [Arsukibacterium sp.]|uniref:alpha/beta hydrolase family protein n=1 Tax=Arsukibacterium sp. TaxID=1977258 RepID=UPI002FD9465D
MQKTLLLCASLWLGLVSFSIMATAVDTGYKQPGADIVALVDAPLAPSASLSPDAKTLLSLQFPPLPALADLAAPEYRLAGTRINPANNGPSQPRYVSAMSLLDISSGKQRSIRGLPANLRAISLNWSPDSQYLAFVQLDDNQATLWRLDIKQGRASQWSKQPVNAIWGGGLQWAADSKAIFAQMLDPKRGAPPVAPKVPAGPLVTEARGRTAPARTYQDLLKDQHDEALFEYYFSSQFQRLALNGRSQTLLPNQLLRSVELSPDNSLILLNRIDKPYSYAVPLFRFANSTEVRNLQGQLVKQLQQQPVADNLPIAFDAVPTGKRSITWRNDAPATLYWVEAADGGDPAVKAEVRDQLFQQAAPFNAEPEKLLDLAFRFGRLAAADGTTALVWERWWQDRHERVWRIAPDGSAAPQLLWQRSSEDSYNDPGSPLLRTAANGQRLLRLEQGQLLFTGIGASKEGNRPFIDRFNLADGSTERLWRSEAPFYEFPISPLGDGSWLTQREATDTPPDFYRRDLSTHQLTALTNTAHPMPQTIGISRELINYQRADGIPMSATLLLPAGYDKARDGALPTVIWAYPREFRSAAAAGQVSDSPYRFNRISYWTPQFLATQGYAVLDNATMPIVGEGDAEPNDTFIQQLILNAEAAIGAGVALGVTDPERVAIGGHSYGAFMTANLLAHTDLFKAGIARSGAYNRSLTPFGFQREQRTLWDDTELYIGMSPFFHAEKIKTPMLLIHGADDNNAGTFPLQSERLYQAIKGNGGTTRLVMLPLESHGYRARESVLHMLWETDSWLDEFVKQPASADAK